MLVMYEKEYYKKKCKSSICVLSHTASDRGVTRVFFCVLTEKMWPVLADRKQRGVRKHCGDSEEHQSVRLLHTKTFHSAKHKS